MAAAQRSLGGAIYVFRRWRATEKGRATWDTRVLKVPVFGQLDADDRGRALLAHALDAARERRAAAAAMDITRNVLGNVELMRVVEDARGSIREGESIAEPLKRSGAFPPIVTHMIAIGERSGQLEADAEHVAIAYDDQVDARLAALTSLLEPLMIVIMGVDRPASSRSSILMPLMQINEFVQ